MQFFLSCLVSMIICGTCGYCMSKIYNKKYGKYKVYKDIVYNVLNADSKTRQRIEKNCNDYLEHKVINSDFANNDYLDEIKILLDDIKFINAIKAIEPLEDPKKESKIEQAINSNKEEEKKEDKVKKDKKTEKGGKS